MQLELSKCCSEVDNSVFEKEKKKHSALIAKLQYTYMQWVRPQETIGLLVLEYSLINPGIPYKKRNS